MSALLVDSHLVHSTTDPATAKRVREHVLSDDPFAHVVLKNFLNADTIRKIRIELKEIFKTYYTPANLRSHAVYLSDNGNQRTSHGLQMGSVYSELPCIDLPRKYEQIYNCSYLHRIMLWILGEEICPIHRQFLGWQAYMSEGAKVTPHQDGEYMDFEPLEKGFIAHTNLAPKYVLLFLLKQEDPSCQGTKITRGKHDEEGVYLKPEVGDAFLFKNLECWHQVGAQPKLSTKGIVRETFGFRSWDVNPVLIKEEGKEKTQLTTREGLELQKKWLSESWPSIFDSLEDAVF